MDTLNNRQRLAADLGERLAARQWRVATAESCTGGGLAEAITAIPGSSQWFDVGFITYSNRAKQRQLGVGEALLQARGAVSSEVVLAMVAGVLAQSGAELGVAISGIAGPGGGTAEKPVGTVWIAWGLSQGLSQELSQEKPWSCCYHFAGDRQQVREQAISQAFKGLLELLESKAL